MSLCKSDLGVEWEVSFFPGGMDNTVKRRSSRTQGFIPTRPFIATRDEETGNCPRPAFMNVSVPCYTGCTDRGSVSMVRQLKIIVEKHADGYVAYPIGLKGVVVGEGESYEEALADVKSAIRFHVDTFGPDVFETEQPVLEAFIAETGVAV